MDLIDRKALLKELPVHPEDGLRSIKEEFLMLEVREEIRNAPTVDAVPVVHGRWEGNETCDAYDIAGVKTWAVKRKCSECGFTHRFIEAHMCYVFCPNCGARMDGEADDHR